MESLEGLEGLSDDQLQEKYLSATSAFRYFAGTIDPDDWIRERPHREKASDKLLYLEQEIARRRQERRKQ